MPYIKTDLPHTYENQIVLREIGTKISAKFGQNSTQSNSIWSRIWNLFPGSETVGYVAGQHLALTYGASWSNSAIDIVVRQFFKPENASPSYWSWDSWKNWFSGATQTTLAESLKLTVTPIVLPYLTIFTGAVGAVALPTVISLVSMAYQKVMFDPRKLQQLSKLSLDQLFTIDKETGRLRDAFGRLFSPEDMQDILTGAAKYDLICKMIDLCHQVDLMKKDDDELQKETQKLLEVLINSYTFERDDGQKMFPDGHLCTFEEKETIQTGITLLSRINPLHKAKKIRRFIKLLSKRSLLPMETLSSNDKQHLQSSIDLAPKRMPTIFPEGEQNWKNAIIRSSDGKYVVAKDVGEKKRGQIVSDEEMEDIFNELSKLQGHQDQEESEIDSDFVFIN